MAVFRWQQPTHFDKHGNLTTISTLKIHIVGHHFHARNCRGCGQTSRPCHKNEISRYMVVLSEYSKKIKDTSWSISQGLCLRYCQSGEYIKYGKCGVKAVLWSAHITCNNCARNCLFINSAYIAFLGNWLIKTETNPFMVSLTPSLSLMLISAPSLTSPSIVYWLPSSAAVCRGVCWERERERERKRENKSTFYNMWMTLASLQWSGMWAKLPKCHLLPSAGKFHWQIAWPPPTNP